MKNLNLIYQKIENYKSNKNQHKKGVKFVKKKMQSKVQ